MKRLTSLLSLATILGFPIVLATSLPLFAAAAAGSNAASQGKQIFLAQKCDLCHSIASQGIEAKVKSEKMQGPDLGKLQQKPNAEWMAKFLKQEETLDGKTHKKQFKGSDEELQTLIDWLTALD